MKILFCGYLLLLAYIACQSQPINFTLGGGILRPFERVDDPYENYRYHRHGGNFVLALEANFRLNEQVAFTPEVGYEVHRFDYDYSGRIGYRAYHVANLWLGAIRLAPAFTFWAHPRIFLRMGVNGLINVGGFGKYDLYYTLNGNRIHEIHTNQFHKIRKFGNFGPEVAIGYRFSTRSGRDLSLRLSGFIGVIPAFKPHPYAPMNPYTARLNLELSYALSRQE